MLEGPLSKDRAKYCLIECLHSGRVIYTVHFRQEMRNDGLNLTDVVRVCRSGAVVDAPEPDARSGVWKYRIQGRWLDSTIAAVVFTFNAEASAVLITIFRRN